MFRRSVDIHVGSFSFKLNTRELDMSDENKPEVMSRRRALSLVGLAALSLAVPTALTMSDATVSEAEAQAAPPTAPPSQAPTAGPDTGTERRQGRRTRRVKRRAARRTARKKGRAERREIRRTGGASPQ
jgi:hypothetical protein